MAASARVRATNLRVASARSRPDSFDERSLVEAARSDPNAFAELYRRNVDRIHNYAYRRSRSQSIAEEVTSSTFEKALLGLGSFRWREPGIAPWLFRIASNELVNYYRSDERQSRIAATLAGEPQMTTDAGIAVDSDHEELLNALARIKPRYQRALSLRYFADLSNQEVAQAMGVSRRTMAVILHRSAAALRKELEQSARGDLA